MLPNMVTLRDINEYLYWEFGFDDDVDEAQIADDWPFELQPTEAHEVHAFTLEGKTYYAISRGALNYLPSAGMSVADVLLQIDGAQWIAARDPINLSTSRLGGAARAAASYAPRRPGAVGYPGSRRWRPIQAIGGFVPDADW